MAIIDKSRAAWLVAAGLAVGGGASILAGLGNPANMGFCGACFLRDTAGALGLHSAAATQYLRPEIPALILGSFLYALFTRRFAPSGGSAPLARFTIAFFVMFGALVFLGCSVRMALRLAAGDLNALIGFAGFFAGIAAASFFIKRGFSLGAAREIEPHAKNAGYLNAFVLPAIALVFVIFALAEPAFLKYSAEGPGSKHAAVLISLVIGLALGALGGKTALCTSGGIRDIILLRNPTLFLGLAAIIVAAFVGSLALGTFSVGFENQQIAHTETLWNFLALFLVGFGSILLSGCPFRQIIMSGEGNADAGVVVIAFLIAAAIAHNFGIAASAKGVPLTGQIAVGIGILLLAAIAFFNTKRN
ncbi:MAG: YedE-related selenium metabolism membrane protein [Helicobacteraceae bacterium]|nr:YedE-related selenium metabolism membrane protein [Helicobacteraceae bacterium]